MTFHVKAESEDVTTYLNTPCLELALDVANFLIDLGWRAEVLDGHYRGPLTPMAEDAARVLTRAFANRPGA